MDKFSKEKRSQLMSKIRGKETKEEILLAKTLWHRGHRYRKNNRKIKGTPDLTFKKYKLAIFVDGEFWHGHNWQERKGKIKSNAEFWEKKIERNIQRDLEVNAYLASKGWTVLRFWSTKIKKNLDEVISTIEQTIVSIRTKKYKANNNNSDLLAAEP
ncbi:very short patch repair endonuclease [Flavobacterium sp. MAH-1]|uniref:Very short patch repair endonuclease n=1 Tax=Flavobacterium agri TaxID=2743471 RepID=A0A7Y8Y0M2_9FLAO|nr:very short patch repair endonuclease [Flavobacterium agri]NUY80262.1 very short patch repair endonuclease [Flavobacterium agri]NYA70287.1 very short patch repair endonuclease [Flavobacterium agri]